MNFATIAAGIGLVKDLKSMWDGLDVSNQEKLDDIIVKAAERFIPEDHEQLGPIRDNLMNKNIPFVDRIASSALHPATREFWAKKKEAQVEADLGRPIITPHEVPPDLAVVCRNCGMVRHVHLHDDYHPSSVLPG